MTSKQEYHSTFHSPRLTCAHPGCTNIATGKCDGTVSTTFCCGGCCYAFVYDSRSRYQHLPFLYDCNRYYCEAHLRWAYPGCWLNGGVAGKVCPEHNTFRNKYCCF